MSTQPSAPMKASSRLSGPVRWVRDRPIWTKLGLIMIVPIIATIVVGAAGLVDQVRQASSAERARTLSVLSGDAGILVHRLQDERASAVQLLSAPPQSQDGKVRTQYSKQQEKTDTANAKYRVSRSTLANIPDNLRTLLDEIEAELGELPVLRSDVEALNKAPLSITESRYGVLVLRLLNIRDFAAQLTGDPTLTDRMRAAAAVATAKEYLSQERVVIVRVLASGQMTEAARREYIATLTGRELAMATFKSVATPDQSELLNRSLSGAALSGTLRLEGRIDGLAASGNLASVLTPAEWETAMVGSADQMNGVEVTLNEQAQAAATQLGDLVSRRVAVETSLLVLTLVLGVLFAWMVARSMARSLRDLRQGALAVAQYGLPQAVARLRDPALSMHLSPAGVAQQIAEPLPVRSRDEFGQVTEAFNAVHLEAVRTAAEQAALRSSVATMFVNLARRSQILVDRLIGHLDRLERGEQDPDRLSELFQLDHLATRMRRNDENLLVLAGADSTRIQREPAALMDVLRASQSEVEHYTRIEFTVIDQDIEIAAHAVNDLVHLVAELFDNATAFSPPDTAINVEARRVGDRAVLQVEDRGIGMSSEQYAELNERLATPPMVDVAVSRMMGLVVVARLATRHGVKVELRPAQGRGTIADVLLPSGVLVPRALAGRAHSPAGFPAARSDSGFGAPAGPAFGAPAAPTFGAPTAPPGRSLFGPPLALESSSAGPAPRPSATDDLWGGSRVPPSGPTPTPPPFRSTPAHGGPPPVAGLGAALAGDYAALQANSGSYNPNGTNANTAPGATGHGTNGRTLPAWYDLTGASGNETVPGGTVSSAPSDADPLPQRRPGQWSDSDAEGGPGAESGFAGFGPPAAASTTRPAGPTSPSAFVAGPAAAGRPPAWPPVSDRATDYPAEAVPDIPQRLSASLDMTSELPRMRSAPPGEAVPAPAGYPRPDMSAAPAGYSDDMTMELPIFRELELESAWFRPEQPSSPPQATPRAHYASDSWSSQATGDEAFARSAGYASSAPQRADWSTGSDTVGRAEDAVSWRSVADDGWLAAQAALDARDGGSTERGLPRRIPMAQLVPGGVEVSAGVPERGAPDRRTPDSVRGLLSAYHRGVKRGRDVHGKDADPTSTGSQNSGREQEA